MNLKRLRYPKKKNGVFTFFPSMQAQEDFFKSALDHAFDGNPELRKRARAHCKKTGNWSFSSIEQFVILEKGQAPGIAWPEPITDNVLHPKK